MVTGFVSIILSHVLIGFVVVILCKTLMTVIVVIIYIIWHKSFHLIGEPTPTDAD